MFRHDNVAGHEETITDARLFQRCLEQILGLRWGQQWLPLIATEGHEVQLSRLLKSLQSPGHDQKITLSRVRVLCCDEYKSPTQASLEWGTLDP
jgi:hypothetical protein